MKENMFEYVAETQPFAMAAPINCEWKMCRIRFVNNLIELGIIISEIKAKVKVGMARKSGSCTTQKKNGSQKCLAF